MATIKIDEPTTVDKLLDTVTVNNGTDNVEREVIAIGGDTFAKIAAVLNSAPSSEYGLVTRNIPSGTQAISASSLPLPSGAATSAKQDTAQTALDAIKAAVELIDDVVKAEDAASADGDKGLVILAKRSNTPAATSDTNGDYEPLQVTGGRLATSTTIDAALPAGANAIGKLAANSGVDIGDVDVTSLIPGTGATNLGKAEDAAHASGDTGVMPLSVRKDTAAALADTDGDYQPLLTDASGRLHVNGSGVTQPISAASLPLPSGAATAAKQPALGTAGTPSADVLSVQGVASMTPLQVADNGGSLTVDGSVTAANTAGDVAHDGADSGNPVKVGGKAVNAEPSAVANGDRANLITDLVGKLITLPYANPENFVSGATAAMTGTTSTSLIAAPGSGLRNYITQITVTNSHATVGTDVEIQDGNGGTTIYVIPAAAVYGGATVTFPVPLRQPTANTALYVKNSVTGASTRVSASGYKGA